MLREARAVLRFYKDSFRTVLLPDLLSAVEVQASMVLSSKSKDACECGSDTVTVQILCGSLPAGPYHCGCPAASTIFCDFITEFLRKADIIGIQKTQKEDLPMSAVNMNAEAFRAALAQSEKPVLVDFWAPWCTYCRRIGPAYDKIAQQYADTVLVAKINIDDEGALAEQEQIEVIPTLVLYRNGAAAASIVAPDSKAMIDSFLEEALKNETE